MELCAQTLILNKHMGTNLNNWRGVAKVESLKAYIAESATFLEAALETYISISCKNKELEIEFALLKLEAESWH